MRSRYVILPFRLWCFALGLSFAITACLPIPHFETLTPTLEGVLRRDGIPVENVQVMSPNTKNCTGSEIVTRTNTLGEFHVDSTSDFELAEWFFGDRGYFWSLCFKFPDGKAATWSENRMGGSPKSQRLECNVSSTSKSNISRQINEPIELTSIDPDDRLIGIKVPENDFCNVVEEKHR